MQDNQYDVLRAAMVSNQLQKRGIDHPVVLSAMRKIPRHLFVAPSLQSKAYEDSPLPIGYNQTISQPYMVGLMTSLLAEGKPKKVLEIGSGCGYQSAILAEIFPQVHSIELNQPLYNHARQILKRFSYDHLSLYCRNGYEGLAEQAPFDGILVAASPPEAPAQLVNQLADGGIMVIPIGEQDQTLYVVRKESDRLITRAICRVLFVPMVDPGQLD